MTKQISKVNTTKPTPGYLISRNPKHNATIPVIIAEAGMANQKDKPDFITRSVEA
jgi:hypothetical protein